MQERLERLDPRLSKAAASKYLLEAAEFVETRSPGGAYDFRCIHEHMLSGDDEAVEIIVMFLRPWGNEAERSFVPEAVLGTAHRALFYMFAWDASIIDLLRRIIASEEPKWCVYNSEIHRIWSNPHEAFIRELTEVIERLEEYARIGG